MERVLSGLLLAVLAFLLCGAAWSATLSRTTDGPMLIVAHRGDVAHWPENTMEGVLAASKSEAHGVEIDVMPSADGTWWLFHDHDVAAKTNGTGRFTGMSDGAIEALRLTNGVGFRPSSHSGSRLSRLTDVLDSMGDWGGLLILDVKAHDPSVYPSLVHLLAARGLADRAWIMCRSEAAVAEVERADPRITSVIGFEHAPVAADTRADAWISNVTSPRIPLMTRWLRPDLLTLAYVDETHVGSESGLIEQAHRWDVDLYITNDLPHALAWSGQ